MDENVKEAVYQTLNTMSEALGHLQEVEDEKLRLLLKTRRQDVTAILEHALSCSLDSRLDAFSLSDEDWIRTVYWIMAEIAEPFQPKNVYDQKFQELLTYIWSQSKAGLLQTMKGSLQEIKRASPTGYKDFVSYFSTFPLWGTLDPERGDYNTLQLRADVLKQHSYDFLWLYQRLEDYLSKRTLFAILLNWAALDVTEIHEVKSIFPDYWEPDIFPDNQDDVLVDVGAFNGDSIEKYVNMYGQGYKKIYAYEIAEDNYSKLCKNVSIMGLHDTIIHRKGAGAVRETMFVDSGKDASANQLSRQGDVKTQCEVVPLDEDIDDTVTFIKMDIEGAEQSALLGCQRIIQTQHPKLAICTYHGYEDIWKVPFMIDCMYPEYKFYLRHYGGSLIPTEFVLLCKP